MPKREGVDALGLPHSVSRNSRPGSSGVGAAAATTLSRPGLYSLGGTLAANSSSSLVGGRFHHAIAGPTTPAAAAAAASSSEPNLLAATGQSYSGPVPAAEAPHLSSTEAFFGRMTLTAPDNMRRRKAEEKEKKKQARRRRAEKGAAAAANIIGVAPSLEAAGSSNPITLGSVGGAIGTPIGHAAALDSTLAIRQKQRRRPALPTSNSTSNLHLHTLEQSRSRSPTRPARPHSAQTNHQPSHEHATSSNSNRQSEARRRAGSDGSDNRAILQRPEPSSASTAAPVYSSSQSQRLDDAPRQSSTTGPSDNDINTDAPLSHATQRRGDIYADLEAMGLPGANESDLEDQPPPFPSHATRPISPPRMPAEGEEWTEEMRRRQEEYEMNRPPDSPPPAFRSEDEGRSSRRERSISSDVSLSDHDSMVEPATQERREWEEDLAAGLTLEERIQRDRARRLLREEESQTIEIGAVAMDQSLERPTQKAEEAEPPTPLDLGRLVKEARARRGMAEALARQSLEEATTALPASTSAPVDLTARRPSDPVPRIPSEPLASTSHDTMQATVRTPGREAAAGVALPIPKKAKIVRRKKKAAISTKQGGRPGDVSDSAVQTIKAEHGQSLQTQNSTRFRDGASAAAARRMALWGVTADGAGTIQALEPVLRPSLVSQPISEGDVPAMMGPQSSHAAFPFFAAPPLLRSDTAASSTSGGLASSIEGEAEGSSDSDEAWSKEDAAFEAMQRKLAPEVVDDESSDEEGSRHPPGWLRSNSIDLARPGSNVPRAPPPLALGRSRGGIDEYSSSSSSSSSGESLARRMADDSDDDSLSPADARDSQIDLRSSSSSGPHGKGLDKGKAPVRPTSLDTSQSLSAPETTTSSLLSRAGQFEEDSGSSHDFDTGDDDYEAPFGKRPRQESKDSTLRRPVSNRLKGLFSTPLSASEEASLRLSATSRASMERLMDPDMGITYAPADVRRVSAREEEELPWDESMRSRERAIALAALEAKKGAMTTEQQARLDALEEIANLQRASAAEPSSSAAGINQNSLVALERLLSRRSYAGQGQGTAATGLTRSGAIHRPEVAAPFVNPRSSIAPRPLGRLPTITSDTRHFPPSRNSTIVSSGRSDSTTSGSPALPFAQSRRSMMGTPNWMTHIPSSEKRALPDPLEPVKRYSNSGMNPPALPIRPAGNRVSAMVERFEGQMGNEMDVSHGFSREPSQSFAGPTPSSDRDHALRRRPPPPPPPSFRGRHQRGTSSSLSRPSSVVQGGNEAALPGGIVEQDAVTSNDSSPTPANGVNALTSNAGQLSELISAARIDSPVLAPTSAFPRSRSRPLPIPPIMPPPSSSRPASSPELTDNGNDTEEAEDETADGEEARQSNEIPSAVSLQSTEVTPTLPPPDGPEDRRAPSLGFTDLDLFASRLADQAPADGTNYDDLHLLSEFLGPAKPTGATAEEVEALSVGVVEVLRKRVVGRRENGKDKVKLVLNVMGVKVERCGVCLVQFKEGNMACVFPCLHVLHEDCARRLLRSTKLCPTCRVSIA